MLLSRWAQPFWSEFDNLQREVNRMVQTWNSDGFGVESAFPPINLWEEGDAFYLEAELPGLEMNDLEVYVTGNNQLTIKGERKAPAVEKSVLHRQERSFGQFVRTLILPANVDDANIEARLEHGVLKLRLPKHESAKPRKIEVKA
jgi:HSP20 family protein